MRVFDCLAIILSISVSTSVALAQQPPQPPEGGAPPGGFPGFGMSDEQLEDDPFVGVTADGTAIETRLDIDASNIDVAELTAAATGFLAGLTDEQRQNASFAVDDTEWRKWSNVDFYERQGVGLAEMDDAQTDAAWALLDATLSAQGLEEVRGIMQLNLVEGELLQATDRLNDELYWFTFMDNPGDHAWGFQLDGHHLILNIAVHDGVVTMTPAFLGSEPVFALEGTSYAGLSVLQAKQDTGLALVRSLDENQLAEAVIEPIKTRDDLIAGAFADNAVVAYAGIRGDALNDEQRALLLATIQSYTGDLKEDASTAWLEEVAEHLDETWFAWIGETEDDAVFYYRIYSPVLLIEFDHQRPGPLGQNPNYAGNVPTRDHIHAVIRTPNGGDYGDLLRQHLHDHQH